MDFSDLSQFRQRIANELDLSLFLYLLIYLHYEKKGKK